MALSLLFNGDTVAAHTVQTSGTANGTGAYQVADPAGSGETVIELRTHESDAAGGLVRVQLLSPSFFDAGEEIWNIFGIYVPSSLPQVPSGGWLNVNSHYGPPHDGSSPARLMMDGPKPNPNTYPMQLQNSSGSKLIQWTIPCDRWVKIARRVRLGTDGWVEIYKADNWNDALVQVGSRQTYSTYNSSNNGGANHLKILNYHKSGMAGWSGTQRIYFRRHRAYDGSASLAEINSLEVYGAGEPPPAPTRLDPTTVDDTFDTHDTALWSESSGSPSVAGGSAQIPPGTEWKTAPAYDMGGRMFAAEDVAPAEILTGSDVDLIKHRLTLVSGSDNNQRVGLYHREQGDGSAAGVLQLVVGPSASDTGIVEIPWPGDAAAAHRALGISSDYADAVGYISPDGVDWSEVLRRDVSALGFAANGAKLAHAAQILSGSGTASTATVGRVRGLALPSAGAVRLFDGTDDRIKIANPPDLTGAWSLLLGFRRLSEAASQFLFTIENEAGTGKQLAVGMWDTGSGLRLEYNTSTGNASQTIATAAPRVADGDALYLITHPGTVDGAPTVHMFKAGAWSSVTGSSMGTRTSIATRKLVLGDYLGNLDWHGHVFVVGIWTRALTTGERDGIDGSDAAALLALTPARLYEPGRDPVEDLTGSGNDQLAVTGTTIDTDNLPSASIYVLGASSEPPAGPVADLEVTPSSLAFEAVGGGSPPPSQEITVANVGDAGGVLTYTAASNEPWVTLSAGDGAAPDTLTVAVDPSGLQPGVHTATITVKPDEPSDPDELVGVTLTITALAGFVNGWPVDANGAVVLATGDGSYAGGFVRDAEGRLVVTTADTGLSWQTGFKRDVSGRLAVVEDTSGDWEAGFLRDGDGRLVVTQTGPFTRQLGLLRDSDGRLAVSLG